MTFSEKNGTLYLMLYKAFSPVLKYNLGVYYATFYRDNRKERRSDFR